jgi:hypothetical protein
MIATSRPFQKKRPRRRDLSDAPSGSSANCSRHPPGGGPMSRTLGASPPLLTQSAMPQCPILAAACSPTSRSQKHLIGAQVSEIGSDVGSPEDTQEAAPAPTAIKRPRGRRPVIDKDHRAARVSVNPKLASTRAATARHRIHLGSAPLVLAIFVTLLGCACARESDSDGWTEAQAESITVIRGMPVRVRSCRGLVRTAGERYLRFDCLAGTRKRGEHFDTVAVLYELRPLGRFRGADSSYTLSEVRFIGGPGIP